MKRWLMILGMMVMASPLAVRAEGVLGGVGVLGWVMVRGKGAKQRVAGPVAAVVG